jgi:hypothetical protein
MHSASIQKNISNLRRAKGTHCVLEAMPPPGFMSSFGRLYPLFAFRLLTEEEFKGYRAPIYNAHTIFSFRWRL